jgi:hypothetical protein
MGGSSTGLTIQKYDKGRNTDVLTCFKSIKFQEWCSLTSVQIRCNISAIWAV